MQCVYTIKYKVVHNGGEIGIIFPMRGLKLGNPISPCIFILCVESLSSYLKLLESQNLINGYKAARNAHVITYLLFADDSYLFFRANFEECTQIKAGLHLYELASWQKVNYGKSSIMLNPNTLDRTIYGRTSCIPSSPPSKLGGEVLGCSQNNKEQQVLNFL